MKRLLCLVGTLLFSAPFLQAQIYADFTVSHGGAPLGTFRARLDYDKAPRVCAHFIGLATGRRAWIDANGSVKSAPFYDGKRFFRLDHDFVIQGGSSTNTSSGSIGYSFTDQYHPLLRHSGRYMLSMAKTNVPNTNGSQFFITLAPTPILDDKHSVFGEVIAGREIIDSFTNPAAFPVNASEQPVSPIVMESVTISGPSLAAFDIDAPSLGLPRVIQVPLTGTRDTASSFRLEFPRESKTAYHILDSEDLQTWYSVQHRFQVSAAPNSPFTITGVTGPRYFSRIAGVSFASVPDAPSNLVAAGKKLILTRRNGFQTTLTFDGNGGGTWVAGSSSGTISSVVWTDFIGNSPVYAASVPFGHEVALGTLGLNLSAPGPGSLTRIDAFVSFHTTTSGFLEETSPANPVDKFRFSFDWVP